MSSKKSMSSNRRRMSPLNPLSYVSGMNNSFKTRPSPITSNNYFDGSSNKATATANSVSSANSAAGDSTRLDALCLDSYTTSKPPLLKRRHSLPSFLLPLSLPFIPFPFAANTSITANKDLEEEKETEQDLELSHLLALFSSSRLTLSTSKDATG